MQAGGEKGSDFAAQPSSRTTQPLSPSHAAGQGFAVSICSVSPGSAAHGLCSCTACGQAAAAPHYPDLLLAQEGGPGRTGVQRCRPRRCNSGQQFTPTLLQQETQKKPAPTRDLIQQETQKKPPIFFMAEAGGIIIIG